MSFRKSFLLILLAKSVDCRNNFYLSTEQTYTENGSTTNPLTDQQRDRGRERTEEGREVRKERERGREGGEKGRGRTRQRERKRQKQGEGEREREREREGEREGKKERSFHTQIKRQSPQPPAHCTLKAPLRVVLPVGSCSAHRDSSSSKGTAVRPHVKSLWPHCPHSSYYQGGATLLEEGSSSNCPAFPKPLSLTGTVSSPLYRPTRVDTKTLP